MRVLLLILLLIVTRASAQQPNLYSEIHWRPDQSGYTITQNIRKVIGDSLGNTYVLYITDRDYRVKESGFLAMKRITTIGSTGSVMKLDPSGNFVWGIGLNGGYLSDIACDKKGNLIVSAIGSSIPGHYLLAYLPSSSVMAEGASNLIMKINPAGQLIWYSKTVGDIYDGHSKIWLDDIGNVYQYLTEAPSRNDLKHLDKYNSGGTRLWSTSLSYSFGLAINVNGAGETYYSCRTYKMNKDGRAKYPEEVDKNEIWQIDANGKKTIVLSKDCPKAHKVDEWNSIQGDYFINQISFNADNTPVFWNAMLMEYKSEYVVISGKKYFEKDGSFVFAEIGSDGKILSDLQLRTGTFVFERDMCNYHDIGITSRVGGIYCGKRKWMIAAPVSKEHNEENPGTGNRDQKLAYITFDGNAKAFTWEESQSVYLTNYEGVGFNYMQDSTLYTWGKRFDADIPPKPNYRFYWFYIEGAKPGKPTMENPEQIIVANPVEPVVIDTVPDPINPLESDAVLDSVKTIYSAMLYPNPTNANSLFQFYMPESTKEGTEANFNVTDGQGKILESHVITVTPGENKVEVVSAGFAMGTYIVSVTSGAMEFHMVLMKI